MADQGTGQAGPAEELPASLVALGTGLREGRDPAPAPALFAEAAVFAVERTRVFARSWVVADHASRLPADGRYVVVDAGVRSLLVTREGGGRLHALGNLCLHAGYPVCEEDGAGERLHCPYHDWEYALDGRLLYPALSPERIDPARLRLRDYPLAVRRGLILVDLSGAAPPEPDLAALPGWLGEAAVVERRRLVVERNWKHLRAMLPAAAGPLVGAAAGAPVVGVGALGLIAAGADRAAVLRLAPKSPTRTDLHLIRLARPDGALAALPEGALEALAAAPAPELDRPFLEWYWSLVA